MVRVMHSQPQGPQHGQQGAPPQGWQGPPPGPYQPPRPPSGRRRKQGGSKVGWLIAGGVAVVVAVMVGGGAVLATLNGGGNAPAARPTGATAAPDASPATGVPTPSAAARTAFLAALAGIDEGLVSNEERAISRGRSTCLDLREDKSAAQVVKNARARFAGGNAEVTNADARQIVAAVRAWCD